MVQVSVASFLFIVLLATAPPALAGRVSSDEISEDFLSACDDQAMPFGAYDGEIAAAVTSLTAMGVFAEEDFRDVKIGFCDLSSVGGPVATISCAGDTILLDAGYAAKDQHFVLKATLAHEMKHYFQHRKLKAEFGEGYCLSDQYGADKTWMEVEADAFGEEVAALFYLGRSIEVRNECPTAISFYLEADYPIMAQKGPRTFTTAPPGSTVLSPERALTRSFLIYAETQQPHDGAKKVWGNAASVQKRKIDGAIYGMTTITAPNPRRSTGPFQLTLNCKPQQ